MNPDMRRPDQPRTPLDDDQLGALIRAVADDWRVPPQRLDQPTWRDRTRRPGDRSRSFAARLGRPAVAAVAATIVLAVVAVWLTAPRGNRALVGVSPSPSNAPTSTPGPTRTPLPKLVRNGDLPTVTRLMVSVDGNYRVADLATGTLGAVTVPADKGPSALVLRPSGGWLCLCANWTTEGAFGPTGLSLKLHSIDAAGRVDASTEIRTVDGSADPDQRLDLQFQIVDAGISVAPDGRTAFFGWTARQGGAGWTSGIDVVDVTTGTVIGSTDVPAEQPAGTEGQPVSRNAPSVEVSPAGDRLLISSFWYVEAPNDPNPPSGIDRWTASFDGGVVGPVTILPAPASLSCDAIEFGVGFIDATNYYLVCASRSGELTVRRVTVDGGEIGATPVQRTDDEFSGGSLVARTGDSLFIWDPASAVLARVNLRTGALTTSPGASASSGGPMDGLAALGLRLGRWIAPIAQAKLLLQPGIVLAPDGTRVYAIGVTSPARTDRGSTGVLAFDAASLAPIGQWTPTADFSSLAVSVDGRFVYAAAAGGVDATGAPSGDGASVTVFDASDGSVRLIAGKLGSSELWLTSPTVQ